jgi:hypothetical protein
MRIERSGFANGRNRLLWPQPGARKILTDFLAERPAKS